VFEKANKTAKEKVFVIEAQSSFFENALASGRGGGGTPAEKRLQERSSGNYAPWNRKRTLLEIPRIPTHCQRLRGEDLLAKRGEKKPQAYPATREKRVV